ncbi:MAG: hypothetical protein JHC71_18895, partial [Blastococcus sp.]|nr:hypothetical protein [Blastococcus sp.]
MLVEVADGGALTVTGADGEVRCLGSTARTAERPDLTGLDEAAPWDGLVADPVVGPFPSVHEDVTVEQNEWYLDAVGEPLALYRENAWAHPGMLVKAVHR